MRRLFEVGQEVVIVDGPMEGSRGIVKSFQLRGPVPGFKATKRLKKETDPPHPSDFYLYNIQYKISKAENSFEEWELEEYVPENSYRFINEC